MPITSSLSSRGYPQIACCVHNCYKKRSKDVYNSSKSQTNEIKTTVSVKAFKLYCERFTTLTIKVSRGKSGMCCSYANMTLCSPHLLTLALAKGTLRHRY